MIGRVRVLVAAGALALAGMRPSASEPDVGARRLERRHVTCLGTRYEYQLESPAGEGLRPAILLLHGAGGAGSDMLDLWRSLAARERVVLIAPDVPRDLAFEAIAPAVFRCLTEDARAHASIDDRRVYLFGYSMGGYLALDGAMYASDIFAAVGVYAAAIAEEYEGIIEHAARRVPIALYIGDRDRFYSTAQVRRTHDLLASRGFPVRLLVLPNQDHGYGGVSSRINEDAWSYLSSFTLPEHAR